MEHDRRLGRKSVSVNWLGLIQVQGRPKDYRWKRGGALVVKRAGAVTKAPMEVRHKGSGGGEERFDGAGDGDSRQKTGWRTAVGLRRLGGGWPLHKGGSHTSMARRVVNHRVDVEGRRSKGVGAFSLHPPSVISGKRRREREGTHPLSSRPTFMKEKEGRCFPIGRLKCAGRRGGGPRGYFKLRRWVPEGQLHVGFTVNRSGGEAREEGSSIFYRRNPFRQQARYEQRNQNRRTKQVQHEI